MNNPFATTSPNTAPPGALANPFAPQTNPAAPSFPVAPTQGVAAIQAAFAFPQPAQQPAPNPFAPVVAAAPVQAAVQYPPLNPPGESGLGAVPTPPPAVVQVEAPVAPEPAPKARRGRKPKAVGTAVVDGAEQTVYTPDGDEGEPTAGVAGDPRNPTRGYSLAEQLAFATTEELREALKSRGWGVTLVDL